MDRRITIDGSREAAALFAPALCGLDREEIWAALLDRDNNLLHLGRIAGGEPAMVEVPLRRIFRNALQADAAALIVAHNHPSGNRMPSAADLLATRRIAAIARPLGLVVLDHLLFADGAVVSFRALGLL